MIPGYTTNPNLREEMRRFARPDTLLGVTPVVLDFAFYLAFVVLAMRSEPWELRLLFGFLAGNLISTIFVLGHDAAHNSLTPKPWLNRLLAYICFLPSLHNYSLWRVQHNRLHHRVPNVRGFDSWSPYSPDEFRALSPWRRWLERHYRSGLGFSTYYLQQRWWKDKFFPHRRLVRAMGEPLRRAAYRDFAILAVWLALFWTALVLLGRHNANPSPWLALLFGWAVPFVVWNFMIGYAVYYQHTHPRIPWFRTAEEMDALGGQEHVTVNLVHSRAYDFLSHRIMQHTAHHVHPLIPHYRLHEAQARLLEVVGPAAVVEEFTLRHAITVVRACKLYDYEQAQWTDFAGRPTSAAWQPGSATSGAGA